MEIDLSAMPARDAHDMLVSALIPRPIAWVSSTNRQGQVNLAPFSFFCGITWSPPTLGFSVVNRSDGSRKDTIVNIEETGQFVVNMVSHDLAGLMLMTVAVRGRVAVVRFGGAVPVECGGQELRVQVADPGRLGHRHRRLVAVVDLAAVLAAPEPVLEFAHGPLEGGVEAVGTRFAAHHRTATACRDLDMLAVLALAPVLLVVEFDVEQVDGAIEALQSSELLGNVDAEVFGDLDVAALDDDVGVRLGRRLGVVGKHGRAGRIHGLG